MEDDQIRVQLMTLKDSEAIARTVRDASTQIAVTGYTIGALAPGDATTYQFNCITSRPFVGNGSVWVRPGERIWWFGTATNMVQLEVEPGWVYGLDEIVNKHTKIVATLFLSLVESELSDRRTFGVAALWQDELLRRLTEGSDG